MRCPWCGSTELVWDVERGDVICVRCGSVVDKIYVSTPSRREGQDTIYSPPSSRVDLERARRCAHLSRLTKEYLKVVRNIRSKKRLKDVVIDSSKLEEYVRHNDRRVKVLKRKPEVVDRAVRDRCVKLALNAMLAFPRLRSRTDRAKVALAMLALALAMGKEVDVKEVADGSGLSAMHVRRLRKLLNEERGYVDRVKRMLVRARS